MAAADRPGLADAYKASEEAWRLFKKQMDHSGYPAYLKRAQELEGVWSTELRSNLISRLKCEPPHADALLAQLTNCSILSISVFLEELKSSPAADDYQTFSRLLQQKGSFLHEQQPISPQSTEWWEDQQEFFLEFDEQYPGYRQALRSAENAWLRGNSRLGEAIVSSWSPDATVESEMFVPWPRGAAGAAK